MHDGVDPPVKQSILFLESWDVQRTGSVMNSATLVGHSETAQMSIFVGSISFPTPLGTRYPEQFHQLSFAPVRL
jgi:hypothetical protein